MTDLRHTDGTDVSTSEALLVEPSALSPGRRAFNTVVRSREFSIFLVLLAVIIATTAKSDSFLFSSDGWRNFLLNPSILLLLAVGQAVVALSPPVVGVAVLGRVLVGAGDALTFISVIRLLPSWFRGPVLPQISQWTGNVGQVGQVSRSEAAW